MEDRKKIAVIVAGGNGQRMQAAVPKQFLPLGGQPVLYYSIHAFLKAFADIKIVLVLAPDHFSYADNLLSSLGKAADITIVPGGGTRFHSVKNGLQQVKEPAIVFVHDGARPLVSPQFIRTCYQQALESGSAVPAIDLKESIREVEKTYNKAADRTKFRVIQTPQVFRSEILLPAFEQVYSPLFTDEATVVESNGDQVYLIPGDEKNIKITRPMDLVIAEKLLEEYISNG